MAPWKLAIRGSCFGPQKRQFAVRFRAPPERSNSEQRISIANGDQSVGRPSKSVVVSTVCGPLSVHTA